MPDAPRTDADMAAYYAAGAEQERLTALSRLEGVRTKVLLERHLPAPPAVVVDCGGGPGAYAVWLAERGYEVHLLDPIALHVQQALVASERRPETPLAGARVGDARALPYADASADAILLLGPLYHLPERADRLTALREARRVLRPAGVLAAAAISRFASTFDGLFKDLIADPAFDEQVARELRDGRHANPERRERLFTTAYFHRPEDFEAEIREAGFDPEPLIAIETPADFLPDMAARLDDPTRRESLLRAIARIETEPTLIGASPHILAIASK